MPRGRSSPSIRGILAFKGSLYLTRPSLQTYTADRADLFQSAERLFEVIQGGAATIRTGQRYALRDASRAHADLEGRRMSGSTLLLQLLL